MSFGDLIKRIIKKPEESQALEKKSSGDNLLQKPLPTQIHTVSEGTISHLREMEERLQKKYLGLVVDATSSRAATWDRAQMILSGILNRLSEATGLHIRVIYFRGREVGDLGWNDHMQDVARRMAEVDCMAGFTQIVPALRKLLYETSEPVPETVILIGDTFEEKIDDLKPILTEYRKKRIKIFSFFEPHTDAAAESASETIFRKISKVTEGVFQEYREGVYLDELMLAVATYTAQGKSGLDKLVKQNSKAALILQKELLQIEGSPEK